MKIELKRLKKLKYNRKLTISYNPEKDGIPISIQFLDKDDVIRTMSFYDFGVDTESDIKKREQYYD